MKGIRENIVVAEVETIARILVDDDLIISSIVQLFTFLDK
jgi:hypothetical protein